MENVKVAQQKTLGRLVNVNVEQMNTIERLKTLTTAFSV